jgi:hypothetical protein
MLTDEIPLVTEVDKRRSWNLRGIHWRHFSVLGHHSIDKLSPRRGSQDFACEFESSKPLSSPKAT